MYDFKEHSNKSGDVFFHIFFQRISLVSFSCDLMMMFDKYENREKVPLNSFVHVLW